MKNLTQFKTDENIKRFFAMNIDELLDLLEKHDIIKHLKHYSKSSVSAIIKYRINELNAKKFN